MDEDGKAKLKGYTVHPEIIEVTSLKVSDRCYDCAVKDCPLAKTGTTYEAYIYVKNIPYGKILSDYVCPGRHSIESVPGSSAREDYLVEIIGNRIGKGFVGSCFSFSINKPKVPEIPKVLEIERLSEKDFKTVIGNFMKR